MFLVTGKWIEYDDDNPIPQREEDITKLSGGGKIISIDLKRTVIYLFFGRYFFPTFLSPLVLEPRTSRLIPLPLEPSLKGLKHTCYLMPRHQAYVDVNVYTFIEFSMDNVTFLD